MKVRHTLMLHFEKKRDKVRNKPSPLLKKPYIGIGLMLFSTFAISFVCALLVSVISLICASLRFATSFICLLLSSECFISRLIHFALISPLSLSESLSLWDNWAIFKERATVSSSIYISVKYKPNLQWLIHITSCGIVFILFELNEMEY